MSDKPEQIGTLFGMPIVLTDLGSKDAGEMYCCSLEEWEKRQREKLAAHELANEIPIPPEAI